MFLEMLSLSHLTTIHNTLSWCGFVMCCLFGNYRYVTMHESLKSIFNRLCTWSGQ